MASALTRGRARSVRLQGEVVLTALPGSRKRIFSPAQVRSERPGMAAVRQDDDRDTLCRQRAEDLIKLVVEDEVLPKTFRLLEGPPVSAGQRAASYFPALGTNGPFGKTFVSSRTSERSSGRWSRGQSRDEDVALRWTATRRHEEPSRSPSGWPSDRERRCCPGKAERPGQRRSTFSASLRHPSSLFALA